MDKPTFSNQNIRLLKNLEIKANTYFQPLETTPKMRRLIQAGYKDPDKIDKILRSLSWTYLQGTEPTAPEYLRQNTVDITNIFTEIITPDFVIDNSNLMGSQFIIIPGSQTHDGTMYTVTNELFEDYVRPNYQEFSKVLYKIYMSEASKPLRDFLSNFNSLVDTKINYELNLGLKQLYFKPTNQTTVSTINYSFTTHLFESRSISPLIKAMLLQTLKCLDQSKFESKIIAAEILSILSFIYSILENQPYDKVVKIRISDQIVNTQILNTPEPQNLDPRIEIEDIILIIFNIINMNSTQPSNLRAPFTYLADTAERLVDTIEKFNQLQLYNLPKSLIESIRYRAESDSCNLINLKNRYEFNETEQLFESKTYCQAYSDLKDLNNLDYSGIDFKQASISNAKYLISTINQSIQYLQSDAPVADRLDFFDEHFSINTSLNCVTFHGFPTFSDQSESIAKLIIRLIEDSDFNFKEQINLTCMPEIASFETAKAQYLTGVNKLLIAYLSDADSTETIFDVYLIAENGHLTEPEDLRIDIVNTITKQVHTLTSINEIASWSELIVNTQNLLMQST